MTRDERFSLLLSEHAAGLSPSRDARIDYWAALYSVACSLTLTEWYYGVYCRANERGDSTPEWLLAELERLVPPRWGEEWWCE